MPLCQLSNFWWNKVSISKIDRMKALNKVQTLSAWGAYYAQAHMQCIAIEKLTVPVIGQG